MAFHNFPAFSGIRCIIQRSSIEVGSMEAVECAVCRKAIQPDEVCAVVTYEMREEPGATFEVIVCEECAASVEVDDVTLGGE